MLPARETISPNPGWLRLLFLIGASALKIEYRLCTAAAVWPKKRDVLDEQTTHTSVLSKFNIMSIKEVIDKRRGMD